MRGRIVSNWRVVDGKNFELAVEIPANTTATVVLPVGKTPVVTVNGQPAAKAKLVTVIRQDAGTMRLAVPSGKYRFVSSRVW